MRLLSTTSIRSHLSVFPVFLASALCLLVFFAFSLPAQANTNPTARNDGSSSDRTCAPLNDSIDIDVVANDGDPGTYQDGDGDPISIDSVGFASKGTAVRFNDKEIRYTGSASGNDSFQYTISDGQGGTDTATVYVRVEGDGCGLITVNMLDQNESLVSGGSFQPSYDSDDDGNPENLASYNGSTATYNVALSETARLAAIVDDHNNPSSSPLSVDVPRGYKIAEPSASKFPEYQDFTGYQTTALLGKDYSDTTPDVTLTASDSTIYAGDNTTLSWSSNNATACDAQWISGSSNGLSGSDQVSPSSDTTYRVTCQDDDGDFGSDTETVYVFDSTTSPDGPSQQQTAQECANGYCVSVSATPQEDPSGGDSGPESGTMFIRVTGQDVEGPNPERELFSGATASFSPTDLTVSDSDAIEIHPHTSGDGSGCNESGDYYDGTLFGNSDSCSAESWEETFEYTVASDNWSYTATGCIEELNLCATVSDSYDADGGGETLQ